MNFKEPDGMNFRPQHEVSVGTLKMALGAILAFLKARDASPNLFRYDDWWEHDGLHFLKDKLTWERFRGSIDSEQGIVESMPGDFSVKVGIAPPKMNWYLRYYVDLVEDARESFLDITVPTEWEKDFDRELAGAIPIDWVREPSREYYKAIRLE